MTAPVTLNDRISRDPNVADLTALSSNDAFRTAIDAEFATLADAADRAQLAASKNEDLAGVVALFSSAVGSLRAIAKRFPESVAAITEALRHTQIAMGLVRGNTPATAQAPVAGAQPAARSTVPPPPAPPAAKK